MAFLKWLATFRAPFWDDVVATVTLLGEETFFMVLGLLVFWCINKVWGYRFMIIGLCGSVLNQLLKAIFLIPRPWVLDPSFTIVEAAREAADGYSFPSGHTQSAATVFGTLAAWIGRIWVTVICLLLILAVGFSRMYLGVHTPLDVGVSFLTGAVTVLGFVYLFRKAEGSRKRKILIGVAALALAVLLVGYVHLAPVSERNIAEFDAHGVVNAWKLLGTLAGMLLAWWVDDRHTHFEVKAVWWAQLCKLAIGFALVMAVRLGLKPILGASAIAGAIRYFLMAVVGGVVWPMTFSFWAKLGKK